VWGWLEEISVLLEGIEGEGYNGALMHALVHMVKEMAR